MKARDFMTEDDIGGHSQMEKELETLKPLSTKNELFGHFEALEMRETQKRITENIEIKRRNKSQNDSTAIISALKNHFLFYNLSEAEIINVKNKMYFCEVPGDCYVYKQGEIGTCFFLLERGLLDLVTDGKVTRKLKSLDGFGELALLYQTPRNFSVLTKEPCTFWVIDRLTFRKAVEEIIVRVYSENKKDLENVRFFASLRPDQKDIVVSSLLKQKYYKGSTIIHEGDPGSTLYYIKEGEASAYKGDKFVRKLSKGDSFGEQSLYYNCMRQLTIKVDEDVTCLILSRDALGRVFGDKINEVTFKNLIRWVLEKNQIISKLPSAIIERIISEMKISSYKTNELIFKKGLVGLQKIVVVIEGGLQTFKTGVSVASKNQCYGEQFLLAENKKRSLDDEIVVSSYGVLAQISNSAYFDVVNRKTYQQIVYDSKVKKFSELTWTNQTKIALSNINIRKLEVAGVLPEQSQFGPLFLLNGPNQIQYVLKAISKKQIEEIQVEQFVMEQSTVFDKVCFPFVVEMGRKFQTQNYLFYINEYVQCNEFYDIMKKIGLLSTQDSQFYIATIVVILEYFESICVVCRDIKPQNFIVDSKGFLRLLNLSTAMISPLDNNQHLSKTYTIIGTPHYMAPDIVIGKGYNNLVDLWSLGVMTYELLCGVLPFGDSCESAYQIYEQIMQNEIKFPDFLSDRHSIKLIEQLLSHNPQNRHGGSFERLKSHCWFDNFDWNSLMERDFKKITPPMMPDISKSPKITLSQSLEQLIGELEKNKLRDEHYKYDWREFGEIILLP